MKIVKRIRIINYLCNLADIDNELDPFEYDDFNEFMECIGTELSKVISIPNINQIIISYLDQDESMNLSLI